MKILYGTTSHYIDVSFPALNWTRNGVLTIPKTDISRFRTLNIQDPLPNVKKDIMILFEPDNLLIIPDNISISFPYPDNNITLKTLQNEENRLQLWVEDFGRFLTTPSEERTEDYFLSEYNLLKNCDYYYGTPTTAIYFEVPIPVINPENAKTIPPNSVIYCWGNTFPNFQIDIFPFITVPFKLVLGYSDFTLPYISVKHPWNHTDNLLNSPNLISIYAPNTDFTHPKVIPIPLGIPRSLPYVQPENGNEQSYMAWFANNNNYNYITSYINQFLYIDSLALMSSKTKNPLIYIRHTIINTDDPHVEKYRNFRYKLEDYLKSLNSPVIKRKEGIVEWFDYMNEMRQYRFSLQPYGTCPNAYRMCESIIVGTIPVFFSSPSAEAYKDLPVLVLDNLQQLTEETLEKEYLKIINRKDYNMEKLTTNYWIKKIKENV